MGRGHLTTGRDIPASGGRLGWRSCLRKGCGRRFQARRYNQRYCREPACLGQVRRWQGAKRQQKCRSQPGARQRHAEAERQRRKQRASEVPKPLEGEPVATDTGDASSANSWAWSRSRRHPGIFCDRPGCYEPLRDSPRATASYCGDECYAAMRRARDRERKWLRRKTEAGRFKRRLEYQAARAKRGRDHAGAPPGSSDIARRRPVASSDAKAGTVLFYRRDDDGALDSPAPTEVIAHDPQGTPGSRPRPPPAS
jgi:hypothetical protein